MVTGQSVQWTKVVPPIPNDYEECLQDELPLRFEGRILPVDGNIAEAWGKTVSRSEALEHLIGAMDACLAATAQTHRLTLVTRNVSYFALLKAILNPWTNAGTKG